ncbi:hypothetical protein AAY473_025411 [Plecturocebus cupreus]
MSQIGTETSICRDGEEQDAELEFPGWNQKSHPKDGPRKRDAAKRDLQQVQPEPSAFEAWWKVLEKPSHQASCDPLPGALTGSWSSRLGDQQMPAAGQRIVEWRDKKAWVGTQWHC